MNATDNYAQPVARLLTPPDRQQENNQNAGHGQQQVAPVGEIA
jgi:hypothetical protein